MSSKAYLDADIQCHYLNLCDQIINHTVDKGLSQANYLGAIRMLDTQLLDIQKAHQLTSKILAEEVTDEDVEWLDRWEERLK